MSGASFSFWRLSATGMFSKYRTALKEVYPKSPHTPLSAPSTVNEDKNSRRAFSMLSVSVTGERFVLASGNLTVHSPEFTAKLAIGSMPM